MYYKDLDAWKESIKLVKDIYEITNNFPSAEIYGITNQIRRCVISVPSNISEGTVKHSDRETLRFLDIALGSLAELDTQMVISEQLGYIKNYETIEQQISKVRALLCGLVNYYNKQLRKDNDVLVP